MTALFFSQRIAELREGRRTECVAQLARSEIAIYYSACGNGGMNKCMSAHPEPAAVADPKSERAIEGSGGCIVGHALQVGFCCAPALSLGEQCGAYAAGNSLPPHVLADKYRVDTYELTIKNAQPGRRDSSFCIADEHSNLVFGNRVIHAGDNAQVDGICHLLEGEKTSKPLIVDPVLYLDGEGGTAFRITCEQRSVHDIDAVLDVIASGRECSVQGRVGQRADLENAGSSPALIDFLDVRNLFLQRQNGRPDRFRAVRPVRIEIGKAENPAVVYLHLVRWPGVERQIFNCFYVLR